MSKYIQKVCNKCSTTFNTRPYYNKEYCKKCTNAIRMRTNYQKNDAKGRIIYVSGNTKESKKQWAIRNKEKIKSIVHT